MPTKFLTVKEAANYLSLSERTIWGFIYDRKVEVVRFGRSVRIEQGAIDELIKRGTTPAISQ